MALTSHPAWARPPHRLELAATVGCALPLAVRAGHALALHVCCALWLAVQAGYAQALQAGCALPLAEWAGYALALQVGCAVPGNPIACRASTFHYGQYYLLCHLNTIFKRFVCGEFV